MTRPPDPHPAAAPAPGFVFAETVHRDCTGKHRFATRAAALDGLRRRRNHAVKQRARLGTYHCARCDGWHHGSQAL